ncbi:hypothetical protein V6N12_016170 [Hibiscus sabdariffa]|uniref:Uncharacterized protein n=1 Tax=Hibiscus sabdariffa TaxID=183260 RepID=A0ABR2CAG2_9ROSI
MQCLEKENQQVQSIDAGRFLERPGSPLASEVQSQCKKSRSDSVQELPAGSDSMEVEENGQNLDESTGGDGGSAFLSKTGGDRFLKPGQDGSPVTYAGIVGGLAQGFNRGKDGLEELSCDPNSVEVLDEDCVVDRGTSSTKIPGLQGTESVNHFAMLEDEQVANLEEQGLGLGDGMNAERGNKFRWWSIALWGGSLERTAVSLFEKGHGNVRSKGVVHGKLHGSRRGVRDGVQQGLKVRKPPDMRTISRPLLNEWVDTMHLQIKALWTQVDDDTGGPARAVVNQDGILEPVARTFGTHEVRATVTAEESVLVESGSVVEQ